MAELLDSAVNESEAEKLCLVCNDMSSGRHYGAFTCEGCKGFFRRIICYRNEQLYACIGSDVKNECEISNDSSRRKCCKYCRFQKCLRIGMKPELCVKIEANKKRNRYNTDSTHSNDDETESECEFVELRHEIWNSFNKYINCFTFDSVVAKHSNETNFSIFLNQLLIGLETNVRQFMSYIKVIRQLNPSIQKELMHSALIEIFLLKICSNKERYAQFIRPNGSNCYFANERMDVFIRSLLDQLNQSDKTSEQLIPVLYVLTIFNSHKVESNHKNYVQKTKQKILKAFDLNDEMNSAKVTQILMLLTQINSLIGEMQIL